MCWTMLLIAKATAYSWIVLTGQSTGRHWTLILFAYLVINYFFFFHFSYECSNYVTNDTCDGQVGHWREFLNDKTWQDFFSYCLLTKPFIYCMQFLYSKAGGQKYASNYKSMDQWEPPRKKRRTNVRVWVHVVFLDCILSLTCYFLTKLAIIFCLQNSRTKPPGIRNLGNTCFMSSVLQCLRCKKSFRNPIKYIFVAADFH